MKLIEITVHEGMVWLLYADETTKDEASEWIELQLKAKGDDNRRLGVIQKNALERVQAWRVDRRADPVVSPSARRRPPDAEVGRSAISNT